jgi:TatA/E family protein of Tat protein translocase
MPGAFSPVHIFVVLLVALIVLGPKELPKVARGVARALRELRALRARLDEEFQLLLDDDDSAPRAEHKPEEHTPSPPELPGAPTLTPPPSEHAD